MLTSKTKAHSRWGSGVNLFGSSIQEKEEHEAQLAYHHAQVIALLIGLGIEISLFGLQGFFAGEKSIMEWGIGSSMTILTRAFVIRMSKQHPSGDSNENPD